MASDASSSAPSPQGDPPPSRRRQPRTPRSSIAFVRLIDPPDASPLPANLINRSGDGLAFSAMIPLTAGSRIAIGTTDASARPLLLLARVVHCNKRKNGRFQIGAIILDQQDGSLHTTKIPDAWRQA